MTLNYLSEMANFESYLLQKEFKLQIPFYLENFTFNFDTKPILGMSEILSSS